MHVSPDDAPPSKDVRTNLQRLAAAGLATHISEMDVMLPLPASRANRKKQATLYAIRSKSAWHNRSAAVFPPGHDRSHSWIPEYFSWPGRGAAISMRMAERNLRTTASGERCVTRRQASVDHTAKRTVINKQVAI